MLHEQPWGRLREPCDGVSKRLRHRRARNLDVGFRLQADFTAMNAGSGQLQGRKQPIDLTDLPPGEDRHGPVERLLQAAQGHGETRRRADVRWRRRNIEHRAVEIEKEGNVDWIVDLGRKRSQSSARSGDDVRALSAVLSRCPKRREAEAATALAGT